MPMTILFVQSPVPESMAYGPASGEIHSSMQRLYGIVRSKRRNQAYPAGPESRSQRRVSRIASRNSPVCRAIGKDKIIDGKAAEEGEGSLRIHGLFPGRFNVNSTRAELWKITLYKVRRFGVSNWISRMRNKGKPGFT